MNQNPSYACPVCNGFTSLPFHCPHCGASLQDQGRLQDFFDPYSPYRPIEDIKMTDGWIDHLTHQCPHEVTCPQCGYQDVILVNEIKEN